MAERYGYVRVLRALRPGEVFIDEIPEGRTLEARRQDWLHSAKRLGVLITTQTVIDDDGVATLRVIGLEG